MISQALKGLIAPPRFTWDWAPDLIQVFRFAHDGAAHGVPVAVDVLGQAFHAEIGPQLDGPLVEGGGEGVVHTEKRSVAVGDVRDGGDIRDGQGGIARRLDVNELGVGADGRLHIGGIGRVHKGGFHAEFFVEQLVEQAVYGDVGDAGKDTWSP